jgi:hypothetical protein
MSNPIVFDCGDEVICVNNSLLRDSTYLVEACVYSDEEKIYKYDNKTEGSNLSKFVLYYFSCSDTGNCYTKTQGFLYQFESIIKTIDKLMLIGKSYKKICKYIARVLVYDVINSQIVTKCISNIDPSFFIDVKLALFFREFDYIYNCIRNISPTGENIYMQFIDCILNETSGFLQNSIDLIFPYIRNLNNMQEKAHQFFKENPQYNVINECFMSHIEFPHFEQQAISYTKEKVILDSSSENLNSLYQILSRCLNKFIYGTEVLTYDRINYRIRRDIIRPMYAELLEY